MRWQRKDIIDYYRKNQLGYGLWGRNMHYGYWDESTKHIRQATQKFNEILARKANICDTDLVLDAGCGVGGSSIYLAKTAGCHVTGITICPHQVEAACKNAKREGVAHLTEFKEMDYLATTFADKHFDVVWGLESACYAESKAKLVREAYRVLKDNGRLIIADGFASKEHYDGIEQRMMQRWLDGWIVNSLDTSQAFLSFANGAGFRTATYQDITGNVFLTSKIMYYSSLVFCVFHLIDSIKPLRSYPGDALYHQYRAMKRKLWEYGIFYAEK